MKVLGSVHLESQSNQDDLPPNCDRNDSTDLRGQYPVLLGNRVGQRRCWKGSQVRGVFEKV